MRNIFIDCGYNVGDVTEDTYNQKGDKYEYFAFEANPYLFQAHKDRHSFCKLEEKAVWVSNCILPFYVVKVDKYGKDNAFTGASTLNKEKSKWNMTVHKEEEKVNVEAFDFSEFILNNFKKEDNIIIKMDIEGAEYKVLNKMIEDDSLSHINQLVVEFHDEKTGENKESIMKEINNRSINFSDWH